METKTGSALVIGAGISGIRSALDLAEMHYHVFLIDKAPNLGGILSKLDSQFPSDHCGMCRMLPAVERDSASQFCLRKGFFHENIEILLSTEMVALEGEPGRFTATLLPSPTFIDQEKCIGCGACSRVCAVEVADEFNAGLMKRKAVYLPVPHNIPNRFVIDMERCTRCGECEKVCPTGAINLQLEARRNFRILVVDDNLAVRDSLKEWLEVEGFSVEVAASGPEAIDMLPEKDFNLMLLDIKMPEMDGVEVLKITKEMKEDLPVLMMTAYATVETAIEAMKVGAIDYLMKPFDIDALIARIVKQYESSILPDKRTIEVGAVIMAAGSGISEPIGETTYGYGVFRNVITSTQFERLISGTGPNAGRLLRPSDGKPVEKVAWLQCVGSRNVRKQADYCSSICCMFSIKEALLAKSRTDGAVDTTIFYMDMRTYGKDFQRYRDKAERESGVRFVRTRIHSVASRPDGSLLLGYPDTEGRQSEQAFDLVVLAAGQKSQPGTAALAEQCGIELNEWGFCRTENLAPSRTRRDGIFSGGSFSGLKDISESVIQADSASLEASRLIHSKGGSIAAVPDSGPKFRDTSRELPRAALVLCTCGDFLEQTLDLPELTSHIKGWDSIADVFPVSHVCTRSGWESLSRALKESGANLAVIGACAPCLYGSRPAALGKEIGLSPGVIDVVDIHTPMFALMQAEVEQRMREVVVRLRMSLASMRETVPKIPSRRRMIPRALVVGGGVAGMTAALAIADHGFEVDLVEKSGALGGLALRIHKTIDGASLGELLRDMTARVESHDKITVHTNAGVIQSQGRAGEFFTTIEEADRGASTLEHGIAILATGGREASSQEYCYGRSDSVLTQLELEEQIRSGKLDPSSLQSVAMIQCVGSRVEGRNYCSRICCTSALKNALDLKEKNPEINVYVLYRDMMTYGFLETYYTRARKAGVLFVQYTPERKPQVSLVEGRVRLEAYDPILGGNIMLQPDRLVLSTGMIPNDQRALADVFGLELNEDGFLKEAEYKWLPVNSPRQGVFLCGTAHSPRSIPESIAMAQAAAQRALGFLGRGEVQAGTIVAEVRHSLCSLCERCVSACPHNARMRNDEEEKIEVDELACQGCGACAAICPNGAAVVRGFGDRQVMAMLDAALE